MAPPRLSAPAFPADVLFMKSESVIGPPETSAAPPLAFPFVFTFPMNTLRVMDPLERTAPPPLPLWLLFKKVLSEIVTLPFRAPPPPAPALLLLKKLLVTTEVPSTAPPAVALLFVKVTPLKVPPPPTAPPPPKTPPLPAAILLSKTQLFTVNASGPPDVGPPMLKTAAPSLAWWPFRIVRWLSVRWPVFWRLSKIPKSGVPLARERSMIAPAGT